MVISSRQNDVLQLELIPNCSASWYQTRLVVFALGSLTLAIGVFWAFMGAWVILPFAGLEALLLGYLTYKVCLETYHKQVLYISDTKVDLEYGKDFPKKRWSFDRASLELEFVNPSHSLSAPEVVLRDGSEAVPIGERLSKQDKDVLINELKGSGVTYRILGTTTTVAIEGFDL